MNLPQSSRPFRALLVGDRMNDVELTRRGFEQARFHVSMDHVENGVECLKYLRKEPPHGKVPDPDLILLDLNMPLMSGREVLAEMVEDEKLRLYPVVVLTTSEAESDVLAMYRLRCSAYLSKPISFPKFLAAIEGLAGFWLSVAQLPPPADIEEDGAGGRD